MTKLWHKRINFTESGKTVRDDKPGSVQLMLSHQSDDHSSNATDTRDFTASRLHATRGTGSTYVPYLVLHRSGLAKPLASPPMLVSSYLAVSPLPRSHAAVSSLLRYPDCGISPQYPAFQPGLLPCGAWTFLPTSSAE